MGYLMPKFDSFVNAITINAFKFLLQTFFNRILSVYNDHLLAHS